MQTNVINVLPEEVYCRIAAGEVVERPASVVKELIENSIDANATKIEIEVKDGGQKLIEVTDNGTGMRRQDAILAFSNHATSKIKCDSDLEQIATLGFRGEALPTIAAVSRVVMVTKHDKEETATKIQIDGGKHLNVESTSFPQGTRIQIKNIFYNVPARRKFLKSIQSEMAQISDVICHYMMAFPEIAFKFTKSNILIASTTGSGNLMDAILAVYGPEITENLKPLSSASAEKSGLSIRGYISPPNQARSSSRYITTLVNRRYVKTKIMMQAINKAIGAFFPKQKYPVLVMDFRLPPQMLDVNVHPQKTEVRFQDERLIFATIWETVQTSLSGLKLMAPQDEIADIEDKPAQNQQAQPTFSYLSEQPQTSHSMFAPSMPAAIPANYDRVYELHQGENETLLTHPTGDRTLFETVVKLQDPKIIAQLKRSYLLGEDAEGLFIVDQHAAHERILFDQYLASYKDQPIATQPLLFPVPLKLLPSEKIILKSQQGELKKLGFSLQLEEDEQYYLTSVPITDKNTSQDAALSELLSGILEDWDTLTHSEIKTNLFKMMACKAAVKAGDKLDESEWNSLLEQLLKTPNPFTCPHGRPIVIRISTKQIEKGFLRT